MNITFIGDVHGHRQAFAHKVKKGRKEDRVVLQIGDLGVGFGNDRQVPELGPGVFFIRGNHDNPDVCRQSTNYLGEFGYSKALNLFFVGGAWSIDKSFRKEGRDWWADEELSMEQCSQVLTLWDHIKPDYVVTHDAPPQVTHRILMKLGGSPIPNRTCQLLQQLFSYHKPKIWLFGHWHVTHDEVIDDTRFICLPELGELTLDIPPHGTD